MILNFTKIMHYEGRSIKTDFVNKILTAKKLHTVREDPHNRWKPGMEIHFSTGARSGNYNCFRKMECISTQKIIINNTVWIDNRQLEWPEFTEFAANDGFEDVDLFWAWFTPYLPFEGKIIHWTNLKY